MKKKNNYFYASAVLTMILATLEIVGAVLLVSIFFASKENIIENVADPNRYEFIKGSVITGTIISLIFGILTIIEACFFFNFAKYDKQKLEERTALVIIMIILQVIFGGLIACAISVAGIIVGKEEGMAEINNASLIDQCEYDLKKVKKLHDEELIDEEEYQRLRNEILNKFKKQD